MSETILNRTYTPPPVGSFDPLTAAITGTIPSFYTYGPPRPRTPSAPASGGLDAFQPSDGGGGGDGGGLGSGGVNMGGEMAGSIDLGPNPGNLGNIGNLSNIDLSNISLSGAARGAGLGGMVAGPIGGLIGAAIGAFGPAISDARNAQETARAQQAIHDRAVEAMFAGLDPKGIGDVGPNEGPVSSPDKSEPGTGGEKGDPGPGPGAPGEASTSGGDMGGGPSGDSGDGYKEGGLVAFREGGVVPLQGGGKIAIGPGGGLDDLIPTSINGRQAAALSDGEFVIPADVVSMMGDGSSNAGARRLYDLVRQVRDTKTGTTRQAGPLPVGEILKRSLAQ
jgi:hypothetical protein